jgi:hypothetical protein
VGYFDSVADQLGKIRPPLQKRYNDNGVFILGIVKTRMQKSTRLGKPDTFIADLVTLQSSSPSQEVGAKTQWAPSMAWDGTLRDIMSFIAAAAKARFEDITTTHLNLVVETKKDPAGKELVGADGFPIQENPLFGRIVKCRVYPKLSDERKAKGKEAFSAHDWMVCPADIEPAMIAKFNELIKAA